MPANGLEVELLKIKITNYHIKSVIVVMYVELLKQYGNIGLKFASYENNFSSVIS